LRALATINNPSVAAAPPFAKAFVAWAHKANDEERADAASALARAYLHSGLAPENRDEVAIAMTALLDDRSVAVRRALAEALAAARDAPRPIAVALANDASEVAAPLLARSPALTDAELVDCAAVGDAVAQCAIARRRGLGAGPAAALAEIGERDAALALIENPAAELADGALRRIVERFGDDADVRQAISRHPAAPASLKAEIAIAEAKGLSEAAAASGGMSAERAARIGWEAQDKALCEIAAACAGEERAALVQTLRTRGALTIALLLRSLLGGKREFFAAALADLSGQPYARAAGLARAHPGQGFAALALKAGLPRHALPAFRAALGAIETYGGAGPEGLKLRLIEETAAACEARRDPKLAPILGLVWRLAGEAAKGHARDLTRRPTSTRPPLPPGLALSPPANDAQAAPPLAAGDKAQIAVAPPIRAVALDAVSRALAVGHAA